ncbi:MAG: hypothetical protein KKH74_08710 [Gammaproteobacteria bacterium]|nr:hypothetical protein [Gammaproteobacteria bacterium]MBU1732590.1 hypothetical protein [Gammaproteobacteria bacterium]MBU1893453.1 hypothetical protein [Gammaproteobacteria bacterium]
MPALQNKYFLPAHNQRGAALMLLLLLVSVGALAVFVSGLNRSSDQQERDRFTTQALARAKEALIGYVAMRQDPERPGDASCPDNSADGNYDGTQDAPCGNNPAAPRLGRLPWKTAVVGGAPTVTEGLGLDIVDGYGERLWYAVSRNLVDPAGVAQFNPLLLAAPPAARRPWITVRDSLGNVVSDRVAAIFLAPGIALAGQLRSGATPTAGQYFDNLAVGGVNYSNADSDDCLDGTVCVTVASRTGEDFIIAPRSETFNDVLAFVTIDELMVAIDRRVANEIRARLEVNPTFPASLGDIDVSSWPNWFNDNGWSDGTVTTYTRLDDDNASIRFTGCASTFSYVWSGGKAVLTWDSAC